MMRQHWLIILTALSTLALGTTGCIKPEAPNAEADIISCQIDQSLLFRATTITNDEVIITLNGRADRTQLAPTFTLTEGAKISPESGTTLDFSTPQIYTVTSEDGQWKKSYKVHAELPTFEEQPIWHFTFEGVSYHHESDPTVDLYPIIEEHKPNGELFFQWQSGNHGIMFSQLFMGVKPSDIVYGVTQDAGKVGKSAKLVTMDAGSFAAAMGKPIAAGTIFMGIMDVGAMMGSKPLTATKFGIPFIQKPLYLTGYYKYKAGDKVIGSNGKAIAGAVDTFDIYAILFETTDKISHLNGTNSLTSPQLVSIARIKKEDKKETSEWQHFELKFESKEGKTIDEKKLKEGKYSLSIIATSSIDGASFKGAIGSTLWLDELQLTCE